jgi:hypothetical protein
MDMEITLAHPMVLLCNVCQVKACFVRLEIVLFSAQQRCTVCAECTTFMEIFLGTPMVLQGDVGQVEARFGPFGDSITPEAR